MVGIPLGSMLGARGIWGELKLGAQLGVVVRCDAGRSARRTLGGQIATRATQAQPALDTPQADLEDMNRLPARHASIKRIENPHP